MRWLLRIIDWAFSGWASGDRAAASAVLGPVSDAGSRAPERSVVHSNANHRRVSEPVPAESHAETDSAPRLEIAIESLREEAASTGDHELLDRAVLACRSSLELPVFPDAARRLHRLLKSGQPPMTQVLAILRTDLELSRRVLAGASSAAFASTTRDIDLAVRRLGTERIFRIAMSSIVDAPLFRVGAYQAAADAIRERALVAAEVAAILAPSDSGDAYLAGLFQEVGALFVLRLAMPKRGAPPPSDALVQKLLAATQASFGALIAESWSLPPRVVTALGAPATTEDAAILAARDARVLAIEALSQEGSSKESFEARVANAVARVVDGLKRAA